MTPQEVHAINETTFGFHVHEVSSLCRTSKFQVHRLVMISFFVHSFRRTQIAQFDLAASNRDNISARIYDLLIAFPIIADLYPGGTCEGLDCQGLILQWLLYVGLPVYLWIFRGWQGGYLLNNTIREPNKQRAGQNFRLQSSVLSTHRGGIWQWRTSVFNLSAVNLSHPGKS